MKTCPPCSQDCAQGRACPARFDSEDHLQDVEHRLCSVQTIGLVLALFGAFAVAVIVAVVSTVGRVAGWW